MSQKKKNEVPLFTPDTTAETQNEGEALSSESDDSALQAESKSLVPKERTETLSPVVSDNHAVLRLIPVKNSVLFPHNMIPISTGKDLPLDMVDKIVRAGSSFGVVTQRDGKLENPKNQDVYLIGTEAKVVKVIRFPDGAYGAVVHGLRRFKILEFLEGESSFQARVVFLADSEVVTEDLQQIALGKSLKQLVQKAISLSPSIPSEAAIFIENVQNPAYLSDLVVPYLSIEASDKQMLLEISDVVERLQKVHFFLTREIEILEMSQKIHSEVKSEVGKQQRKYYLKEQLKLLQKELGEIDGKTSSSPANDPVSFRERIEKSQMPAEAREAALREVERLQMMQPVSPEYMVSHTYITWLLDVPWGITTQSLIDLKNARRILDEDHYGLEKIKKRILEFLAVYALKGSLKGPILLLVGPPGVGKTSLGRSIAKALGRKFARIALGGVRDEAEIRGHRRTYIGSMPGKIVDALKKTGSMDPVILLDEVDKIAGDQRGDPASALLEVLDSEQNHTFTDHYLNTPVDLSKVLFVATANSLFSIPGPLRDRMEVLELSGYTLSEKSHIAFEHLFPQVRDEHGISEYVDLKISEPVMKNLIQHYTREAGVRQLRRELSGVVRGVAYDIVENGNFPQGPAKSKSKKRPKTIKVEAKDLDKYLGAAPFPESARPMTLPIGVSTGLAYTPVGGDVLYIETAVSEGGSGKLTLTGQLGDVMKESVQTALAFLQSHPKLCEVSAAEIAKSNLHVHFPSGAVKKDGPSAGVAVFLAMVSQFSKREVSASIAVTGEISLRGEILPVGGIKEKLLAAHRLGIQHVLIPKENERDLKELPQEVLKELKITGVKTLSEAIKIVFAVKTKKPLSVSKPTRALKKK